MHYEQGLGDNIQFVRYLPMVKELGGTVVLEAPWPLYGLFKDCEGCDELILAGEQPPAGHFDLTASPLDFPGIFQTRPETVPARVPYLFADVDKARAWWTRLRATPEGGHRLGGSLARPDRGGLVVHAAVADRRRAVYSSKGPAARAVELRHGWADSGRRSGFSDLAAAMINLDLIITVDTAAAHLAGAMAKPSGRSCLAEPTGGGCWTGTTPGILHETLSPEAPRRLGGCIPTCDERVAENGSNRWR